MQNRIPVIEKQRQSASRGQKYHREPLASPNFNHAVVAMNRYCLKKSFKSLNCMSKCYQCYDFFMLPLRCTKIVHLQIVQIWGLINSKHQFIRITIKHIFSLAADRFICRGWGFGWTDPLCCGILSLNMHYCCDWWIKYVPHCWSVLSHFEQQFVSSLSGSYSQITHL